MNYKAVLFDGYGTLFEDAMIPLEELCGRVIQRHRLEVGPVAFLEAWDRHFFPLIRGDFVTLREADRASLECLFRELEIEDSAHAYIDPLFERFNRAPAYPEVKAVLAGLDGCATGIVSNADVENIEGVLEANGLEFSLVVTSEDARCYKPAPGIFRRALERLDCEPGEVLYVGDSQEDDIVGAMGVGIRVAWLNRNGASLRPGTPHPDYEMRSLEGVLEIL